MVKSTIGYFVWYKVNPLPNNNILDVTKLKAFVEDKSNVD